MEYELQGMSFNPLLIKYISYTYILLKSADLRNITNKIGIHFNVLLLM